MEKLKKTVLYISGPGALLVVVVAIFVRIFTLNDAKPWLIGGLLVFFVVFVPLYSVEYFKQNFGKEANKHIRFKKKATRTEWEGGNIHGKVPKEVERPGKLFK